VLENGVELREHAEQRPEVARRKLEELAFANSLHLLSVSGLGFQVSGLGFRVSGLGFQV
jgi:hypothetical protein